MKYSTNTNIFDEDSLNIIMNEYLQKNNDETITIPYSVYKELSQGYLQNMMRETIKEQYKEKFRYPYFLSPNDYPFAPPILVWS